MSATKLFMIGYFVGAALFAAALMIILLRAVSATMLDPTIPLIAGFVLMFGSKYAARAALPKTDR